MIRKILYIFVAISTFIAACSNEQQSENNKTEDAPVIGKPDLKLSSDIMTPEVLWSFGRLGELEVSPDGKTLIYGVSYYSVEQNKGNSELYTMSIEGGEAKRITETAFGEYNPLWTPDGKKIGFLSPETGDMQMWEMNTDGTNRKQISDVKGGISGFKYSPDGKKLMFFAEVPLVKQVTDIYPDLPKADARVVEDIMYRHWDSWTDSYSHIFIADYDGQKLSNITDIMEGEEFDSPLKPFGGAEEITWSIDSKNIAYTCVKKKGKAYAISTNSDIYIYNIDSKSTINLTEGMNGYDKAPAYSPDGKNIAWSSMERDGYESDKIRLFVYNFDTKTKSYITEKFDQNADGFSWADDSKSIYFVSDYHACDQIYKTNIDTKEIKTITKGVHDYTSVFQAGNKLIGVKMSMSMPREIFAVNESDGKETQISFINKEILDQLTLGKVEERWIKTTDNKQMHVWVIYPPHFDKNKKYPALLYCEGGPQSTVSQFFSFRWNFQMMAANGYIVVAPNRRGLPGFGQEWNEQISGDYGGQNMKDYFSAIDELKKEPFIDANKLGAIGASYGGFSVYWIAGHHEKRFKAFIAHDGIFNLEAQYTETEEMWFANWDLGGPYWDKNNKIAQKSFANSPHKFVDKWDTPILCIQGGKDYRIVDGQGMSAFNAAILKGVPAKLLYFPNENHWVLKPQNGILWQREFKGWLDKYLK